MADPLKTGSSALLAFQRAISTTSHNIANSATEGYTRQRVDLQAMPPVQRGYGHVGQGVEVFDIQRLENKFANAQILQTGSELSRLNTLHRYSGQIDDLLATSALTLTPSINNFFNSLEDANNNPTDMASRMSVINGAESLASNFRSLYDNFEASRRQMSSELTATVNEINELTDQIEKLDLSIVASTGNSTSRAPNDLLDQRDRLVGQLSEQVNIQTIESANGSLDIFIANGQSLYTGGYKRDLVVTESSMMTGLPISITNGTDSQPIGDQLSGGLIGGIADYNRNVLTPTTNELGRMAIVLSTAMNEQHATGIDLEGEFGQDLFKPPQISTAGSTENIGTATANAEYSDPSMLTTSEYEIGFDGIDYTLTRLSDKSVVSGGSTLSMDGITVDVSGGMSAGDSFIVSPTRFAARDFSVLLASGDQLALGSALRTESSLANTGSGSALVSNITNRNNTAFSTPVNLIFNEPPSTFNVIEKDTGTVLASNLPYQADGEITFNGWTAKINGSPESNDTFTIEPNLNGISSNINGLNLSAIQHTSLIENTATLADAYGSLVANVGTRTRQAKLTSTAVQSTHNSVLERRDNVSGVNLDEEAINLTRYQQAYQAAAQVINTADQMFQSLIGAIR